jgi:hypothetical protein
MDRAADRILRAELDLPYRRYLVLYGVDQLRETAENGSQSTLRKIGAASCPLKAD